MAKTGAKSSKASKKTKTSSSASKPKIKKMVVVKSKSVPKKNKFKAQPPIKAIKVKPVPKKPVPKKPVPKKPVQKKAVPQKHVPKKLVQKKVVTQKLVQKKTKSKEIKPVIKDIKEKKTQHFNPKSGNSPINKNADKIVSIEKKPKKIGKIEDKGEASIEKKLRALINLQLIDSQIDKIRIVRGELPLEVQDLEDEIAGIQTRIENFTGEANVLEEAIIERKNAIKQCQTLIKKYEAQQSNVRNNREYDSLSKEIEFQNLDIQLCEKRIKEFKVTLETKKEIIEKSTKQLEEKQHEVDIKKAELTDIVEETEKEEGLLLEKSLENQRIIEDRLLFAYKKIRKNARNGLAVVIVERDACGGCFNKIPPQRQLDIRIHKKIIVCEYCGRILVDPEIGKF
jgi:predicted  nucleic acid-binding Zn-ribbon protein